MTDFTEDELYLIGRALDCFYYHGDPPEQKQSKVLLKKVVDKYCETMGNQAIDIVGHAIPITEKPVLEVGDHYRINEDGHKLDGQRVKLHHVKTELESGFIRTWVINGILEVIEVPYTSLVTCQ